METFPLRCSVGSTLTEGVPCITKVYRAATGREVRTYTPGGITVPDREATLELPRMSGAQLATLRAFILARQTATTPATRQFYVFDFAVNPAASGTSGRYRAALAPGAEKLTYRSVGRCHFAVSIPVLLLEAE